jgi:hypothetical protein
MVGYTIEAKLSTRYGVNYDHPILEILKFLFLCSALHLMYKAI